MNPAGMVARIDEVLAKGTRTAPEGHPWPAGHGLPPTASAVSVCGLGVLTCPEMTAWAARHPARCKPRVHGEWIENFYPDTDVWVWLIDCGDHYASMGPSWDDAMEAACEHAGIRYLRRVPS